MRIHNALLTFAFPILMTFVIAVPFITSAQETPPNGSKKFGEITIPQEINPQSMELPPAMQPDPNVSVMKVYTFESTQPLRRIVFTQTKFLKIDLDDEIIDANGSATINSFTAASQGRHTLSKSTFEYPNLKGKRISIKVTGADAAVYECFQFHDRKSIWWINFIGQGDGGGIAGYADSFMRKVSFTSGN